MTDCDFMGGLMFVKILRFGEASRLGKLSTGVGQGQLQTIVKLSKLLISLKGQGN